MTSPDRLPVAHRRFVTGPVVAGLAMALSSLPGHAGRSAYPWSPAPPLAGETLAARVAPPAGFQRVPAAAGSWAEWLRGLPMKPQGSAVHLFNGAVKPRQDVHAAIVDIDVGTRDLQQCADAVMRLRAEWLLAAGRPRDIAFNYTDGKRHAFATRAGTDYASFRKYMNGVFAYAGTYSLDKELRAVPDGSIDIGDVLIKGGFPGHAVLVADLVRNPATGERRFLLLQSYMPAQDIHVLKNPSSADGSPWYAFPISYPFPTPEWTFPAGSHKRWP